MFWKLEQIAAKGHKRKPRRKEERRRIYLPAYWKFPIEIQTVESMLHNELHGILSKHFSS